MMWSGSRGSNCVGSEVASLNETGVEKTFLCLKMRVNGCVDMYCLALIMSPRLRNAHTRDFVKSKCFPIIITLVVYVYVLSYVYISCYVSFLI